MFVRFLCCMYRPSPLLLLPEPACLILKSKTYLFTRQTASFYVTISVISSHVSRHITTWNGLYHMMNLH